MSQILLVANYPSDEGYAWWLMENFWVVIAERAAREGRRCVLCYPKVNAIPAAIAAAPIDVVEMAFEPRTKEGRAALKALISERGITSVYLTDFALLSAHLGWLRLQGVRKVVIHDHTPGERRPARGLSALTKTFLHSLGIFSATRYIAVSDFVRDRIIRSWRVLPSRCVTVQNGIPVGRGSPARRADIRRELGIGEAQVVVLAVSRATPYKGVDFLIDVADELRRRGSSRVTLLHCGDAPELEGFRATVRERGLEQRFILAGHRPDARDVMHAADVAIHPSRGEAHCLAILEYMDAGLPVVVPDTRSVSQDVTQEETGVIFPAGDVAAAATALERLAADAPGRQRLGANGRAMVRERFTIEAANTRFARAIEGAL